MKVGLLRIFTSENGTPQGSCLSPLLFLIMVNDFPPLSKHTSDAFFADDCTIWRSGKNINQIIFHLQQDLNLITNWCRKWGFLINIDKTTGIVFSNQKINDKLIKLKIEDSFITFNNTCKMLGVILDKHMTYKPHIDYLLQKSSCGLNIMRCISGTQWEHARNPFNFIFFPYFIEFCTVVFSTTMLLNIILKDWIQCNIKLY